MIFPPAGMTAAKWDTGPGEVSTMTNAEADSSEPKSPDHMPWPESETPALEEERTPGQAVVAGTPGFGSAAFGRAPRPFDLPDNPEES